MDAHTVRIWPDELIGQEGVLAGLEAEALSRRRAHAYLFSGPEGLAIDGAARAYARIVLCSGGSPPCGACEACRAMEAGSHPDFDVVAPPPGKRRIPVDEVRRLISRMELKPVLARGRAFVLERAHALTEEAANALLKTLEEPPDDALIVLVTDRLEEMLPTILSRCRVVRFRVPPVRACAALLAAEGREAERAAVLAALASGSPGLARDLEQEPLFEGRREAGSAILDLSLATLFDTAERLKGLAGLAPGKRAGLEEQRTALLSLFRYLLTFAWDAVRVAGGATARNSDMADVLARTRAFPPARWEAVAARATRARGEVLSNAVPGLVLDAALADVLVILRGGGSAP